MYGAGAGAALFCLESEPTQFGRSRSRLRDFGLPNPEPPQKVATPQHCPEIPYFIPYFFAFNGCICVGWSCIVWATPWPLPGDPGSHPQWCQGRAANHHFSFGRFVFGPLNFGWFKSNSRYWSMTDSTLYAWCADPALKSRNYLIPAKVFPVFRLHFCSGSGLA